MDQPWDKAYDAGQAAYGPLALEREAFAAHVRPRLVRRMERARRLVGDRSLAVQLERSAGADLFAAAAAVTGVPEAEVRLVERLRPRLLSVIRSAAAGADPSAGEAEIDALLLDLCRIDDPEGTGCLLGRYDGTASLYAWLATLLLARVRNVQGVDANLLSGWAEGTLDVEEGQRLRTFLVERPGLAEVRTALSEAGVAVARQWPPAPPETASPLPPGVSTPRPPPLPRAKRGPSAPGGSGWRWVLTALLLAGFTAAVVSFAGPGLFDRSSRRQDSEAQAHAAARDLARSDAGFFGEFETYDRRMLERATTPADRAGFVAAYPRDKVLDTRPRLVWSPAPGASRYVVNLVGEDGQDVWTRPSVSTSLPWPEEAESLPRESTWVWEVRAEGAQVPPARATFRVAAEQDVVRWKRHRERIEKAVTDVGPRRILVAQLALRRGYVEEAWVEMQEHLANSPKDAYGLALTGYLERVHRMHD